MAENRVPPLVPPRRRRDDDESARAGSRQWILRPGHRPLFVRPVVPVVEEPVERERSPLREGAPRR